jgi:two-component system phosphate regulon sensor histidine kinase PhoR
MFRSIQWRITLSFSLLVVVVMTALGVYLTGHVRDAQIDRLRSGLKNQAVIIAEASSTSINDPAENDVLEADIIKVGALLKARITVIDKYGTVIADSEEEASVMENHAGRPEFKAALTEGYGEITRYSTTLGYNMMYIAVPVANQGEVLGVVRTSLPLNDVDSLVSGVVKGVVVAIVITVVLVILAAWLIARLLTKSVRQVTAASKKIAAGELVQRIEISTADETGELARSFNRMSMKLAGMMEIVSEERTRLSGILDNIADGVIMTDIEGKVLLANRAVEKIFRITNGEITGKPLIEMLHDHEMNELLENCLDTGREQVAQFESDLFKRFLRVMAVPVNGKNFRGVLFLIQDLTELRAFQTMRSELIGNISHDFRTPLAGIKAMVETLQDGAIDDGDVAKDFLSRINDEVDRLAQMVSELAELSRIETGKSELRLETVNLNMLINEAISQLRPQSERKSLTVSAELSGDLPDVSVDRDRVRQVILNLLYNAIKFTGDGGRIMVTTGADENKVTVEITDTGIGIAREDLPHIFERFYMADRSRASGGTGMGLAIVKHVIDAHNGTIEARSKEGKGSTFSFSLPVS